MKTVLLICSLFLAGCADESTGVNEKGQNLNGSFQYIIWNGHRYVNYLGLHNSGITHDPDCPYCKVIK
jgi:thioredoxin-related protein